MLPREIVMLVRASARTVGAYRDMKRAKQEGASAEARAKYRKGLQDALEALDKAVVAVARFTRTTPPATSGKPFDWAGPLKVALRGLRLMNELKSGRVAPERAVDIIDAEIIE